MFLLLTRSNFPQFTEVHVIMTLKVFLSKQDKFSFLISFHKAGDKMKLLRKGKRRKRKISVAQNFLRMTRKLMQNVSFDSIII